MCRSIVVLRGTPAATRHEVEAAARQFVRKVAGSRTPAAANQESFEAAVQKVADATRELLEAWVAPPGARAPARTPNPHDRAGAPQ